MMLAASNVSANNVAKPTKLPTPTMSIVTPRDAVPLSTPESIRRAYRLGLKEAIPSVLGMIPFAALVGAATVAAGINPWMALAMSMVIYAGASHLAAIGLMAQHAPPLIVVATVLIVNLRFVMYSAKLAGYFQHLSNARKWLYAYFLTDHLFALVSSRYQADDAPEEIAAYYRAGAHITWIAWNSLVAVGIFAGTLIPKNLSLDFAIPLVFLALVFPALTTRAHWWAAGMAALAAYFTVALPMKLGLIAAALTGVAVGTWLDMRRESQLSQLTQASPSAGEGPAS